MAIPLPASEPAPVTSPARPVALPAPPLSPFARAMAANLLLDTSRGPITPEQAQFWKQQYGDLIKQGTQAVPAIRELLESNTNLDFTALQVADQFGSPNLRQSLFDALKQIGGPEAMDVMASVMATTVNPTEIALLAADLNALAPGQYNDAAVAAAAAALDKATQNPTSQADMSALFTVLQTYGGANAIPNLEQAATKWNYYAPLALEGLPNGSGIPALAQIAQNANGAYAQSSGMALQMLAQLSSQYPDAAQALLAQISSNNNLSSYDWRLVASALGGTQAYYGQAAVPANGTTQKTYHIAYLDQNYASVDVSANWTPQQIQTQIAYINQLMAASPAAAQALQSTRDTLAARLNH